MSAGRMVSTDVRTWVVCSSLSEDTSALPKVTTFGVNSTLTLTTLPFLMVTGALWSSYSKLVTTRVYCPAGTRLNV